VWDLQGEWNTGKQTDGWMGEIEITASLEGKKYLQLFRAAQLDALECA
jgi:hypothetical protein